MRRPLVSVAICLALGILASEGLPIRPFAALAAAGAFTLLGLVLLFLRAAPRWCFIAALAAVAAGGAGYGTALSSRCTGSGLSARLSTTPQILRVRGFIESAPEQKLLPARRPEEDERVRTNFILRVTHLFRRGQWKTLTGRLRVSGDGSASHLTYGDCVEAALSVRKASPPGNPGEFDYARYLVRKGINGLAWAGRVETLKPTGKHRGVPGMRGVLALRRHIAGVIDERVAPKPARILKCLILGDRNALTKAQDRAFKETGTVHFLAISGLHVGLLAAFCWWLLVLCRVRHRPAAIIVLGVVLLYAVMAGFRPSVQRAAIMCAVICGALIFNRKPDLASSLALALIIVLIYEPAQLFSAGLQLSFIAVLGIWIFALPIERAIFRLPDELDRLQAPEERSWVQHPVRWFLQKAISISLAAWLITLPLLMHHFSVITPFTPPASVVLLPAVWLVLVAGLPGVLLAPLLGGYAQPLLTTAAFGAQVMDWVSGTLARVPGVVLYVPPPGWLWVTLCYAAIAAVVYRATLRLTRRRIALLLLLPVAAYLGFVWRAAPPSRAQVGALSMGMGNCVLVQFADGKNLLFDAGSAGHSEVGERVIAPALWSLGVRRLDLVVLSHSDTDHYNGFLELARRIPVGRVAVSRHFDRSAEEGTGVQEIVDSGHELFRIGSGDRIHGFSNAAIDVLWPPRELPVARRLSDNELSIVLRVRSPDGTVLLTGDFGKRAIDMLLSHKPDMKSNVFQVPHHGLPDSRAPRLAAAVSPRVALIPGGRHAEKPSPYAAHAGQLLATDDCGMITVELIRDMPPRVETFLSTK